MGAQRPRTGNPFVLKFKRAARIVMAWGLGLGLAFASAPAHATTASESELRWPDDIPSVYAVTILDDAIYAHTYSRELPRGDAWLRIDADLSITLIDEDDPLVTELWRLSQNNPVCLPDAPDVCFRSPEYRWHVERTEDGGETWTPDLSVTYRQFKRMITEIYGWYGWWNAPALKSLVVGTWGGEPVVVAASQEAGIVVKHLNKDDAGAEPGSWVRYTSPGFVPGEAVTAVPLPGNSPFDTADIRLVWLATLVVGSVFASVILGAAYVHAGSDRKHNPRWRRGVILGVIVVALGVLLVAWSSKDNDAITLANWRLKVPAADNDMVSPPNWPFAVFMGGPLLIALAYATVVALGWHASKSLMNRVVAPVLITAASGLAAWGAVGLVDAVGLTDAADRVMDLWWLVTLTLTVATALVVLRVIGRRTVEPADAPVEEIVQA